MQRRRKQQLRLTLLLPFLFCALSPSSALAAGEPEASNRCTLLAATLVPQEADHFIFDIGHQSNADLHTIAAALTMKDHLEERAKGDPQQNPPAPPPACTPEKFLMHEFPDLNSPEKLRTELLTYLPPTSKRGAEVTVALDAIPALPVHEGLHEFAQRFKGLLDTLAAYPGENAQQIEAGKQSFRIGVQTLVSGMEDYSYYALYHEKMLKEASKGLFRGTSAELSAQATAAIERIVGVVGAVAKLSKDISPPHFMVYSLPENHPNLTAEEKLQFKAYNDALESALDEQLRRLKQDNAAVGELTVVRKDVALPRI